MISLTSQFTFTNALNIILGAIIGFLLMAMISCAILSLVLSKSNKNKKIRTISKKSYTDFFLGKKDMKDKLTSSIIYEIQEVSRLCYPSKKNPMYELSINDMLYGLLIIQKKLKRFVNHPLCKDIKDIHISKILSLEDIFKKPISIITNKKFKIAYKIFNILKGIINLFNPIFYIRKIMQFTILKQGKKDILLICLDFVGNSTYEIYNNSNRRK